MEVSPVENGQPDRVAALVGQLNSRDAVIQASAVEALGEIKDPRSIGALIAALDLKDDRGALSKTVTKVLGDFGPPAVAPLIAVLKETNLRNDPYSNKRRHIEEALSNIGAPAVVPLIVSLTDANPDLQSSAADVLGTIKDPRAIAPLVAAIRNGNDRVHADIALRNIGAPAVAPLIAALKDSNPGLRSSAADILGKIQDPRAIVPLNAALDDSVESVRERSIAALGRIGTPGAVDVLIVALKNSNLDVRQAAAKILGQVKESRAIGPLIEALQNTTLVYTNGLEYRAAEDALRNIGQPAVQPLIAALKDNKASMRKAAASALEKIHDPQTADVLLKALNNRDTAIIAGAHFFFIASAIPGSEDLLTKALSQYGDAELALDFVNSENKKLEAPARIWLRKHGYGLHEAPVARKGTVWGSGR